MALNSSTGGVTLSSIVDGNPIATLVINAEHKVTHWNRACEQLTGVRAAEMIGSSEQWRAFYNNERPILADLIVDGALEGKVAHFYHGKFRRSESIADAYEAEDFFPTFGENGCWLFFTAAAIRDDEGRVIGAIETLQDITARRRAEAALKDKDAFLSEIIAGSPIATMVIDSTHRVTHWNKACEGLTGISSDTILGTRNHWQAFYAQQRPIMCDLVLDDAIDSEIDRLYHGRYHRSSLLDDGYEAEDFFPNLGRNGRWLFFTAAPLRNSSGAIVGAIETLQDVSERRRTEEALRESEERFRLLSLTDALTGLFNSRHFHERIEWEIDRAQRYGRPLSLLVLDADHFKQVNDTWGHLIGDRVLQNLAYSIRELLRRTDSAFRYGGEEFVVLMPETPEQIAQSVAERLRQHFAASSLLADNGEAVRCTVSIGVAEYKLGETSRRLIQRADDATYIAKNNGRNRVAIAD